MQGGASSWRDAAPAAWLPWLLIPIIALLAFALGRCAPEPVVDAAADHDQGEGGEEEGEGEEIWTCSMHPQIRQPEPGQCPLCGMDLIPLGDLDDAGGGASDVVALSDRALALAQVETVEVRRMANPGVDLRLLGRVDVDESRTRNVSAWIGGRVDELKVRETGSVVRRGQVIARLYSPEVYAAHQDLLTASRQVTKLAGASELARTSAERALEAARERLSLLGLPDAEIDAMAKEQKPRKSVAIRTDYGGTVMERQVTQGQYVDAGTVLYRVADLSRLWVQLDAYEADLAALMEGQSVELEVEALPGERFTGEVAFIDPLVDPRRRVARVRVEVDNRAGKLRPGMFVEAVVRGELGEGEGEGARQRPLMVPASAALFTGKRSLVYVELERAHYEPRVVELGPRMGEYYPVVAGLSPGEHVVVHGAFMIDADLQIRGGGSMMTQDNADPGEGAEPGARVELAAAAAAELAAVVDGYLGMQVSLADDDWTAAKQAAQRMADAAAELDAEALSPEAAAAWTPLATAIERRAREAASSTAIEGARGAFLELSAHTKAILQIFGNPLDRPLHLAYCPMANADEGAEWIQAGEAVDNSYFGASMLTCGELRASVAPGEYLLRGGP
ncbi:efflux RND transporter periplasmic adaptor subunit [Pseudenhygromyxa sp. WMMC2535]|uniref:efflux RND transporter periplasmic adaptor subunit n=1 Tax=Pseudenhygromyxa sp. WMMC2535 TaxID=2712867 RepID=UPI0015541BC0|nr:efflux RND transporter periplasmic adaptor subunit [Pseudenhygromyxa sp. WMMC2535]NVB43302.1 efflux RND transporter periplasmic adaptor subunit [Pseudenhygromyxa sp. WMMC2535]